MIYNYIIVGGGLAALYCAREILKKKPGASIIVLEKYKKLGGRAVSYSKDLGGKVGKVQWEIGAGRISTSHRLVLDLIHEYGLHTVPIGSGLLFKKDGASEFEENYFEPALEILMKPLLDLPPTVLATNTLKELLDQVHGKKDVQLWMERFPYYAEIVYMRADRALREFTHEFKSHEGYCACVEGLSALIDCLVADIEKRGGVVRNQCELVDFGANSVTFRVGSFRDGDSRPLETIEAKKIIFALHANALRELKEFRSWDLLKKVTMEPLCRIYAVFPVRNGKSWFEGLPRVVTTTTIRYFIPIRYEKGVAMVSYTDSKYAEAYMKVKDDAALEKMVMRDLRATFPEKKIPDPIFFKAHPWTEGVTYWVPGNYSPEKESVAALKPFPEKYPDIYVCGESFSLRQGWMEGALEHAEVLLKKLRIQ